MSKVTEDYEDRDYQAAAVDRSLLGKVIIVFPENSGMTITAALIIRAMSLKKGKSFWIVPNKPFCSLASLTLQRVLGNNIKHVSVTSEYSKNRRQKLYADRESNLIIITIDVFNADMEILKDNVVKGVVIDSSVTEMAVTDSEFHPTIARCTHWLLSDSSITTAVMSNPHTSSDMEIITLIAPNCPTWTPIPKAAWTCMIEEDDADVIATGTSIPSLVANISEPMMDQLNYLRRFGYLIDANPHSLLFGMPLVQEELKRARITEKGDRLSKVESSLQLVVQSRNLMAAMWCSAIGTFLGKDSAMRRALAAEKSRSMRMKDIYRHHPVLNHQSINTAKQHINVLLTKKQEHPKLLHCAEVMKKWHSCGNLRRSIVFFSVGEGVKVAHDLIISHQPDTRVATIDGSASKRVITDAVSTWNLGYAAQALLASTSKVSDVVSVMCSLVVADKDGRPVFNPSTELLIIIYDTCQCNSVDRKLLSRLVYLHPNRKNVSLKWMRITEEQSHLREIQQSQLDVISDVNFDGPTASQRAAVQTTPIQEDELQLKPKKKNRNTAQPNTMSESVAFAYGLISVSDWPVSLSNYLSDNELHGVVNNRSGRWMNSFSSEIPNQKPEEDSQDRSLLSQLRLVANEKRRAATPSPQKEIIKRPKLSVSPKRQQAIPTISDGNVESNTAMRIGKTYYMSGVPLSPEQKPTKQSFFQPIPEIDWDDIDVNVIHPNNTYDDVIPNSAVVDMKSDDPIETKEWVCTFCCNANQFATLHCAVCKADKTEAIPQAVESPVSKKNIRNCQNCGTTAIHEGEELCSICSSTREATPHKGGGDSDWVCTLCCSSNPSDCKKCSFCSAERMVFPNPNEGTKPVLLPANKPEEILNKKSETCNNWTCAFCRSINHLASHCSVCDAVKKVLLADDNNGIQNGDNWPCDSCGKSNVRSTKRCTACGIHRATPLSTSLVTTATDHWICNTCSKANQPNTSKCSSCRAFYVPKLLTNERSKNDNLTEWNCGTCQRLNKATVTKCSACEEEKHIVTKSQQEDQEHMIAVEHTLLAMNSTDELISDVVDVDDFMKTPHRQTVNNKLSPSTDVIIKPLPSPESESVVTSVVQNNTSDDLPIANFRMQLFSTRHRPTLTHAISSNQSKSLSSFSNISPQQPTAVKQFKPLTAISPVPLSKQPDTAIGKSGQALVSVSPSVTNITTPERSSFAHIGIPAGGNRANDFVMASSLSRSGGKVDKKEEQLPSGSNILQTSVGNPSVDKNLINDPHGNNNITDNNNSTCVAVNSNTAQKAQALSPNSPRKSALRVSKDCDEEVDDVAKILRFNMQDFGRQSQDDSTQGEVEMPAIIGSPVRSDDSSSTQETPVRCSAIPAVRSSSPCTSNSNQQFLSLRRNTTSIPNWSQPAAVLDSQNNLLNLSCETCQETPAEGEVRESVSVEVAKVPSLETPKKPTKENIEEESSSTDITPICTARPVTPKTGSSVKGRRKLKFRKRKSRPIEGDTPTTATKSPEQDIEKLVRKEQRRRAKRKKLKALRAKYLDLAAGEAGVSKASDSTDSSATDLSFVIRESQATQEVCFIIFILTLRYYIRDGKIKTIKNSQHNHHNDITEEDS